MRSWRSWMPARKSCASRIIGRPRRAGDGRLDLHLDARQGALDDLDEDRVDRAALRRQPVAVLVCRGQACAVHVLLLGDDEVAERVDAHGEAGVQGHRRAELLDDRRALDRVAGPQVGPPVDVGGDVAGIGVEADGRVPARAVAAGRAVADGGRRLAAGEVAQLGPGDRADAGDAQVDPLDLLARVVAEVVAVERAVLVVEARRPRRRHTPRRPARRARRRAPRRPARSSAGRRCARSRGCSRGEALAVERASPPWPVRSSKTFSHGGVVEASRAGRRRSARSRSSRRR